MRAPVPVYLILSKNVLHESLQNLILRFVAGLHPVSCAERGALIFVAAAGPRASFLMATFLAGTKLVNKKGELSVLDPAVPTYLYFGAVW